MLDIKRTKQVYLFSMSNIKQIEIWTIKNMQDIKHKWVKERWAIANMGELFRGSSHLLYVPAFTAMKNFHYNHPIRSLGAASPTTSSLKNSWTRKSLTYSRKNNTHEPTSSPRPQPLQLLKYKGWNQSRFWDLWGPVRKVNTRTFSIYL